MSLKHFTHKYRSNSFESVFGQEYIIKFLKNSLFKSIFYPVYLFHGLRGTGKTSVARLFAAALLCHKRDTLQKNIHQLIPCKECESCRLFFNQEHPDFYEFDAASHSGVDSIRSIMEHVYLASLVSQHKVYIIDEVHMLSKAAFSACLKIMEEPPKNVTFILATTDVEKVLDTIRSRSISLSFHSFSKEQIVSFLSSLCIKENISYTEEGLSVLATHAEGSLRDALNTLEYVYISGESITEEHVVKTLRMPSKALIKELIKNLKEKNKEDFFNVLDKLTHLNIKNIWEYVLEEIHYNIYVEQCYDLVEVLNTLYNFEKIYFESHAPLGVFECLFWNYYTKKKIEKTNNTEKNKNSVEISNKEDNSLKNIEQKNIQSKSSINLDNHKKIEISSAFASEIKHDLCKRFIAELLPLDTVIASIFQQADLSYLENEKKVICSFNPKFFFYKDFLEQKKNMWNVVFESIFGNFTQLLIEFKKIENREIVLKKNESKESNPISVASESITVSQKSPMSFRPENNNNNYYQKRKKIVPTEEYDPLIKKIAEHIQGVAEYTE